jgi:CheY-like chemotaxis protein
MVTSRGAVRSAATLRILLIEDSADDRAMFASMLRRCDVSVLLETVNSAEGALRHLNRGMSAPDLVFLDVHLPGLSSLDLLGWVRSREEFKRVLVIAITGDLAYACVPPANLGVDALLVKPIAVEDLAAILALARTARG